MHVDRAKEMSRKDGKIAKYEENEIQAAGENRCQQRSRFTDLSFTRGRSESSSRRFNRPAPFPNKVTLLDYLTGLFSPQSGFVGLI
jgi:hypothetical protein